MFIFTWNSGKKRLYTNFIERQLGIKVTVRKLHTVQRLINLWPVCRSWHSWYLKNNFSCPSPIPSISAVPFTFSRGILSFVSRLFRRCVLRGSNETKLNNLHQHVKNRNNQISFAPIYIYGKLNIIYGYYCSLKSDAHEYWHLMTALPFLRTFRHTFWDSIIFKK